jgi:hypothetical protein
MRGHSVRDIDRFNLSSRSTVPRYPASSSAVDLAYEVSGERDKPVLLLIHGGTSNRRVWDLVKPALRRR